MSGASARFAELASEAAADGQGGARGGEDSSAVAEPGGGGAAAGGEAGVAGVAAPRVGSPAEVPREFTPIVLEKLDECLFRGPKSRLWRPRGQKGVYGGQVLSQSLSAALQSVAADKELHSMHSYFLRAGKETADIIYTVVKLRDGVSFSTRMVTASQGGEAIFVLIASFAVRRVSSLLKQDRMPIVPNPEDLPSEKQFYLSLLDDPRCPPDYKLILKSRALAKSVMDVRRVLTHDFLASYELPADSEYRRPEYPEYTKEHKQILWMRANRILPDDPNVHRAVLAYASDNGLLSTAKGDTPLHDLSMIASLDHSMWFHTHEFRADEWLLYEMHSPRVAGERGLAFGKIYKRDGTLAVTVAQEGVIRLRSDAAILQPPAHSAHAPTATLTAAATAVQPAAASVNPPPIPRI
jgi:acyl-CoA thioesterase II